MFIHGIEKEITVDGLLIPTMDGFRIQANFVTPLSDYKIKIPQIMFFKIDENIQVEVDFYVKKVEKQ